MKVLLFDDTPAYFCPGGKLVLAKRIHDALRAAGVDVEFARWWDEGQRCDVLHAFGCSPSMLWAARQGGAKVVLTHIVDGMTNAPPLRRLQHRVRNRVLRAFPPLARLFPWHVLPQLDALVYLHGEDAATATALYGVPTAKTHVIPHACTREQLDVVKAGPRNRQSYVVSLGSIVPRKNTVLLARAARRAQVPVVFVGKPFNEGDPYFREFLGLVDGKYVLYRGFVSEAEKVSLLQEASGFALLSAGESGCIAVYEAAAAGLPLLLSDLPWTRVYGTGHRIARVVLGDERAVAERLAAFFRSSERAAEATFPIASWADVADSYIRVYRRVLG